MPLAFESISHGTIAFGFFNIESDMLLLDRFFFFSTAFCGYIDDISACGPHEPKQSYWHVYHIPDPEQIGDLMGAIHGLHFTGFIGELYGKYPFPQKESEFKQKPQGLRTQHIVEAMISKYAKRSKALFTMDELQNEVAIGPYRFSGSSFRALIRYVWQGGYPRWKDEQRPDYVLAMKERIDQSHSSLFQGLDLSF
ncbi:MAG: hypothetical protein LJE96_02805 [Deltaproteobacteria bacterium]|nr:hypothetical protein [Deltaproteobacteria bacterium]